MPQDPCPTHPGETLRTLYMEPLGLTVTGLAERLGVSRKTLSKVLGGHGAVTPDMALRLSRAFGASPRLWLNLQMACDLWAAERAATGWDQVSPLAGPDPDAPDPFPVDSPGLPG